EIAIALRTRELLGLPMPQGRLGIGGFHRIHSPPSLERLAARLDRLIDRYNDIERLAQLRAARLRREADAAPVLLGCRPASAPQPRASRPPSKFFVFFCAVFHLSPDARIRAPP
ncbi:MAG TPA: hypothetical protein VFV70_11015, partial [Hyphomonadaceae bacterium]|nr:hypothetical protein [Hyphomonadaceae bacterium]